MIKAIVEDGKVYLTLEGGGVEIVEDTACLIRAIYSTISGQDPKYSKVYRDLLLGELDDPESPVWKIFGDGKSALVDMEELKRQMEEQ